MPVSERESVSTIGEKIDLLGRQEFIDQIINVVETLADNKKNACFAINGEWGVGKTFVLEKFEQQIREYGTEGTTLSKYLVFHYNCWQYDYYEEPLIAIVAALLDQIDEQVALCSNEKKEKIKAALKVIGLSLWGKVKDVIKDKTNIDFEETLKILQDSKDGTKKKIEANHNFDSYFDFKEILLELSKTICDLAEDQTVILVVDELDRCLPEYTIKVLERLHHVFDEIPNVQVVLAVDKQQLDNTIKQIYGEKISTQKYLAKFIDFEITLPAGEVADIVKEMYPEYYNCFIYDSISLREATEAYTTILNGIDIRSCKEIVSKSQLCHGLLNPDGTKCDIEVLCIELFLTLLKTYGLKVKTAKDQFNIKIVFSWTPCFPERASIFSSSQELPGLAALSEKYAHPKGRIKYFDSSDGDSYINVCDIWGLLLGCYRVVLGFEDAWGGMNARQLTVGNIDIIEYSRKYWNFLQAIN